MPDRNTTLSGDAYVVVGALGVTRQTQYAVAELQQPARDRMENFLIEVITDRFTTGGVPDRQGHPLADHGYMAGLEECVGRLLQALEVGGHLRRVITRSG